MKRGKKFPFLLVPASAILLIPTISTSVNDEETNQKKENLKQELFEFIDGKSELTSNQKSQLKSIIEAHLDDLNESSKEKFKEKVESLASLQNQYNQVKNSDAWANSISSDRDIFNTNVNSVVEFLNIDSSFWSLDKSTIENKKQVLENAKSALVFDSEVNKLNYLDDNLKEKIKQIIRNNSGNDQKQQTLDEAKRLNTKVENLKSEVDSVRATEIYQKSTPNSKKSRYDNYLESNKNTNFISNKLSTNRAANNQLLSALSSDISSMSTNSNSNKKFLDGRKVIAIEKINNSKIYPNLSSQEKSEFEDRINSAWNLFISSRYDDFDKKVQNIYENAKAIDDKKQEYINKLSDVLADEDLSEYAQKNSTKNYQFVLTNDQIKDFTNKIKEATLDFDDTSTSTLDSGYFSLLDDIIKDAKKQTLKNAVNNYLTSLNPDKKNRTLQSIENSSNFKQGYKSFWDYGDSWNDSFKKIVESLNKVKNTSILQSEDYIDSAINKNYYNNLIKQVEDYLKYDGGNTGSSYYSPAWIDSKNTPGSLLYVYFLLDGVELNTKKKINELFDGDEEEIKKFTDKIDEIIKRKKEFIPNETTDEAVSEKEHINKLIEDVLAKAKGEKKLEELENYINKPEYETKDPEKRKELEKLIENLKNEINKETNLNSKDYDKEKIEELIVKIENAKSEIDNSSNVPLNNPDPNEKSNNNSTSEENNSNNNSNSDPKNELIKKIEDSNNNLSDSQRQKLIEKVKEAGDEDLSSLNKSFEDLNSKMKELRKVQKEAENLTESNDFRNATDKTKTPLKEDIENNSNLISEDLGDNVNWDELNNKIDELVKKTKEDMSNLKQEASEKLEEAKQNALKVVEDFEHLNNAQKSNFKDLINNSTLIESDYSDSVSNNVKEARDLDDLMSKLENYVYNVIKKGDNSDPKAQSNYVNAVDDLKDNFDNSYKKASDLLDKENGSNLDWIKTNVIYEEVKSDYEALDGEEQKAKVVKELQDLVDKSDDFTQKPPYTNTSDTQKDKYNKAIEKAKEVLGDLENNNSDQIKEAIKKIINAIDNISKTKEDFKKDIDNLNNLTNKEKENYKRLIDEADENVDFSVIVDKTIEIDSKRGDLIKLINSQPELTNQDKEKLINFVKEVQPVHPGEFDKLRNDIVESNDLVKKLKDDVVNNNLTNEELDEVIKTLKDKGVDNSDYEKIINGLKKINNLKDALEKYQNSKINDSNYPKLKNDLIEAINDGIDFDLNDPSLKPLKDQLIQQKDKWNKIANAEIKLVDALNENDLDKFNEALGELNKLIPNKYKEFNNNLEENSYFEIANKSESKLNEKDLSLVKKIEQKDASNVIYSSLKHFCRFGIKPDSLSIWWWIILILALIGFENGAYFLYKRYKQNKKKEPQE